MDDQVAGDDAAEPASDEVAGEDEDGVDSDHERERVQKVAAICTSCGAAYAAERWSDEKIRPIGRREGCRCGGTTFEVVDDSSSDLGSRSDSNFRSDPDSGSGPNSS
ncbi:hypothetical protein ACFQS4_14695 [Saliphagus sp. GCM10025317]